MKRSVIVAALPLLVGGCLPLPIAIASSTFTGISYLASGKSTSDHVLSAALEQDCALTRPVLGEPFCRDIGPNGEGRTPAVTVAHYPGDRDEVISPDERRARWSRGVYKLDTLDETSRQVAATSQFLTAPPRVTVAGIILTKDQIVPAPDSRALPVAGDVGWGALGAPNAKKLSESASVSLAVMSVPAEPTVRQATAAAVHETTAPQSDAGADHWVVLGSFRSTQRAHVMVARYSDRHPQILPVTVKGDQWHRVVLGPMGPTDAKVLRDGLGKIDGRFPWVVQSQVN